MSKFTKALEKLQEERKSETTLSEKQSPNFAIPESVEGSSVSWERGIQTVRNAKPDTRIVAYHFPSSLLTEQYRMLSHNLKTQLLQNGAKVILVSSAIHGEGKTITATNLAIALTEMGNSKVALIDADLRRGRVSEYLGLTKGLPGLSGFLTNGLSVKQALVRNSIENLVVVPSGDATHNPASLLGSQKFRVLLTELRNHFDYILVDSPPILPVADAGILGRDTDGLLMVIQTGRTPKSVIAHANILFKQAGIKMLGYVLTNVEFQSADYRYHYYHYYQNAEETQKGFWDRVLALKDQALFHCKRLGPILEKKEQQFNQWWQRIIKRSEKT